MKPQLGKHCPRIIAGYSDEMLRMSIAEIMRRTNAGPWELQRLEFLKAERDRRASAKLEGRAAA